MTLHHDAPLAQADAGIAALVHEELVRQQDGLELIASENFTSRAVLEAMGSCLTNKYAEGYPGKRYYGGCEVVDKVEQIAIDRARQIFGADHANVQPHSGAQANFEAYMALIPPGEKILGMSLPHGGHLSHGSSVNHTGQVWKAVHYGVQSETGRIDYNVVREIAKRERPRVIICGGSAYARIIDFTAFRSIADEVGAFLVVDMAHFAGLVAGRAGSTSPRPSLAEIPAALAALLRISRRHPGALLDNLRSPVPRASVQTFLDVYSRPSLTWENLSFLREITSLPVVLKGVLHPDDARRAVEEGVDGVIVSTHGGRQVDGAQGSLDALPGVVAAIEGRIPVLMDSGVRGGADIVKAIALGATAVCIGRPYAYGLGLAGTQGVSEVLSNLAAELDLTMGLCGYTALDQLGPDVLARRVDG